MDAAITATCNMEGVTEVDYDYLISCLADRQGDIEVTITMAFFHLYSSQGLHYYCCCYSMGVLV